jgi:alanyl-tRNA synthetase
MSAIATLLKAKDSEIEDKIAALTAQVKALSSENETLKNKLAQSALGDVMSQVQDVKGVKVLATRVPGLDAGGLRELGDQLRDKIGQGVVVLVTTTEDKVSILAVATADAVDKGAHAGNIVKTIAAVCDGKGGGRPDSAMAGGKDVSKADAVVAAVADTVAAMIKD